MGDLLRCRVITCRELAKAVQNELAEANTVAEEVLSSMATVRSHAAEDSARAAYQHRLHLFYKLCVSHPARQPKYAETIRCPSSIILQHQVKCII